MTEKRKLSSAHFNIEGEILGRTYPAISRHHTFLNVVPLGFQARLQSKSEERNPGYEGHQRFTLLVEAGLSRPDGVSLRGSYEALNKI